MPKTKNPYPGYPPIPCEVLRSERLITMTSDEAGDALETQEIVETIDFDC